MRWGVLRRVMDDGNVVHGEVDIRRLGVAGRKQLLESVLQAVQEDNEKFLLRLRERADRVGIDSPKIEVRFEGLSAEADTYAGSRALPTLLNATINSIEGILGLVRLHRSKKRVLKILNGVTGIIRPSRMTLLLGPPASGKTTLLLALAGKLDKQLRVAGKITYNGYELREFVPQRTGAYISQHDVHNAEMTVRETLDFSGRCQGVGPRYNMLVELSRREKEAGIKPDPEIDAFMKAAAAEGQGTSIVTDYILKLLGLEICADTIVGDQMRRGISGGQKKRVTTGEMLVGPSKAMFMDGISTGLDSSTTFQIVKYMRQFVHIMDGAMLISLLQPAPETYELFDDVILLSEGRIVYQGPREDVLEFFEFMGFRCPERKGVADFLQEVMSKKDQQQYWRDKDRPYRYISAEEFSQAFSSFRVGEQMAAELKTPFDKSKSHPAALETKKYGISSWELFKACFAREWLLMKRNSFVYMFKTSQITFMSLITMTVFLRTQMKHETFADGQKYFGALFFSLINVMFNGLAEVALTVYRLPVFYRQRDFLFYPPWAFALPIYILRIPLSILDSGLWIVLTYYTVGFAPGPSRCFKQFLAYVWTHQMALGLFRFLAAVGRTLVISNTIGIFTLLVVFTLGGFVVSKDEIKPWWIWGYWSSPMMYGQKAIALNEFLDQRWNKPNEDLFIKAPTLGTAILKSRGMPVEAYWYWISIGALIGFSLLFNLCFVVALKYMNPLGNPQSIIPDEEHKDKRKNSRYLGKNKSKPLSIDSWSADPVPEGTDMNVMNRHANGGQETMISRGGMVLPFQPLSLAFDHVNYYVDMPPEMKGHGFDETRLQLLHDVSGAFRPGVLTALVGVSGAGKTTLMDVLAGRKTGGYIEGSINISGYAKKQGTFARVSGYCEQEDIHSPYLTVHESVIYSSWLRLSGEVNSESREMFVEEVLTLVELDPLRNALVGLPGVDGLSTEQRKRLTIAVELVANPSIIFMDEPTTGLDARAAAIVMRTVRNTVDTGRTVVCTIHQPSIDIFEAFDELLLMKRGGQTIYAGPLGHNSNKLIEYFEAIPGVPKIRDGQNPATWMLEVTSASVEAQLDVDFAKFYAKSSLYRRNQELIKSISTPVPGSKNLFFRSKYCQSFLAQCRACLWKQYWSYWRNPEYNAIRFLLTVVIGLLFGSIFWGAGKKTTTEQQLTNLVGSMYSSVMFLGASNAMSVLPIVSIERTVMYREKAAGMYSAMAYAIGQVGVEVLYIFLQTTMFTLILFPMIGFPWIARNFLWFFFFMFTSFIYFTLYGMMAVALTPGDQIGAIVMSFFLTFWNLFSGFLITRPAIPIWWRWYYWGSPVAWTIYGLITSQLGDLNSVVFSPEVGLTTVKHYLETVMGYRYDFLGFVAVAHLAFDFIFLFIFAFCIRFLNFQKR
ncbi:unnamed protein product [Victoria cruziana]